MAEYIVQGESLTPIADNIRSIQGKTETMFLNDMKTGLDTIKKDIDDAFTTIGNKGGTVPSSKTSGNLSSAIESISTSSSGSTDAVEVKRHKGTLTSGQTQINISCGFKPDAIFFGFADGACHTGVFFLEANLDELMCSLIDLTLPTNSRDTITIAVGRTESGFTATARVIDGTSNYTINYTAIKYS